MMEDSRIAIFYPQIFHHSTILLSSRDTKHMTYRRH